MKPILLSLLCVPFLLTGCVTDGGVFVDDGPYYDGPYYDGPVFVGGYYGGHDYHRDWHGGGRVVSHASYAGGGHVTHAAVAHSTGGGRGAAHSGGSGRDHRH